MRLQYMELLEFFIWSAMTGGLLVVLLASVAVWVLGRSAGTARNVVFVLVTGLAVVSLCGLPEYSLHTGKWRAWLPFKVAIGPLAGALALTYLGIWLGIVREDPMVRRAVVWGSAAATLCGMALMAWALVLPPRQPEDMLLVSGLVNGVAVVLGAMIALRGASMGDSLAMRMCVACAFMAVMVAGLYAKALHYQAGAWFWAMVAMAVVFYYLMVISLTTQRERAFQRLRKLANGALTHDPATGLPIGAALVSKVDDAIWRAVRLNRSSVVMAVWVANLYELHETAGRDVDQEIHTILTARLRRSVGFRNVVGLYHPRCYMVAITAVNSPERIRAATEKAYKALVAPMVVGSVIGLPHKYRPELGMAVVTISAQGAQATHAMNQAERASQNALNSPGKVLFANLIADPIDVDTSFDQIG